MSDPEQEITGWAQEFEAACRHRDFAVARRMFAPDALAFGTYATAVSGIESIEREQWRNVWPRIRDFPFSSLSSHASGDSAWVAAEWSSEATGTDGRPFRRPGRGTFILTRRDGRWLCVHSHFSLLPSQSEAAHGRP